MSRESHEVLELEKKSRELELLRLMFAQNMVLLEQPGAEKDEGFIPELLEICYSQLRSLRKMHEEASVVSAVDLARLTAAEEKLADFSRRYAAKSVASTEPVLHDVDEDSMRESDSLAGWELVDTSVADWELIDTDEVRQGFSELPDATSDEPQSEGVFSDFELVGGFELVDDGLSDTNDWELVDTNEVRQGFSGLPDATSDEPQSEEIFAGSAVSLAGVDMEIDSDDPDMSDWRVVEVAMLREPEPVSNRAVRSAGIFSSNSAAVAHVPGSPLDAERDVDVTMSPG
jgi:hypothetical protein